ncbi:MAG: phosphotransferase [Planctomycetota bacterium]
MTRSPDPSKDAEPAFAAGADAPGERAGAFRPGELAVVLAQYDLGVVRSVRPFERGARAAPKALIQADRGRFLLKRRRPGDDDPVRVAAVHTLQIHLSERGFPLPQLVGLRSTNNSMLQLDGAIYELFEHVEGVGYSRAASPTADAGRWLAVFHRLAPNAEMPWAPPSGGYHASRRVASTLKAAAQRLGGDGAPIVLALDRLYRHAADRVEKRGARRWPRQLIHGDWHAGNMLFHENGTVAAVLDYDNVRLAPRVLDVAQGLAQFSINAPMPSGTRTVAKNTAPSDPRELWPARLDLDRLAWFVSGYAAGASRREGGPGPLTSQERRAAPWLMIESLIAEAVEPVARTGQFLKASGPAFLRMIHDKAVWIAEHADSDIRRALKTRRPPR